MQKHEILLPSQVVSLASRMSPVSMPYDMGANSGAHSADSDADDDTASQETREQTPRSLAQALGLSFAQLQAAKDLAEEHELVGSSQVDDGDDGNNEDYGGDVEALEADAAASSAQAHAADAGDPETPPTSLLDSSAFTLLMSTLDMLDTG